MPAKERVVNSDHGNLVVHSPSILAMEDCIAMLVEEVHERNLTWWFDPKSGETLQRNVGEMLMLTVSELAEAMEGHRKSLNDDHLPQRKMIEVELADALIRIFGMAGGLDLDIGGAFAEKMVYNAVRKDHKPAARIAEGGKRY